MAGLTLICRGSGHPYVYHNQGKSTNRDHGHVPPRHRISPARHFCRRRSRHIV